MSQLPVARVEASVPQELVDLQSAIRSLSSEHRGALESHFQRVVDASHRRKKVLNLVQEALSQLRMDMKYLMFDLEATRRERASLQAQIDGLAD